MVTRERAQLILVGSLAIALVIIGLTVLVNTILFTESVGSGSLDNRIQEAQEFDSEAIDGVRSLVFRISHADRNLTETELRANVARNVTSFSRAIGESYASTRPVAVTVDYSNASEIGTRIVQDHDAPITDNSANPTWSPFGPEKTVGWLSLNVDVGETDTDPFFANATNATSGRWVNVSVSRLPNGNVSVVSNVSDAPNTVRECAPARGRVLLDVYEGRSLTSATGTCSFTGTSALDPPYDLAFEHGDNLVGKYSLVTRESVPGLPSCDGLDPADAEPCVAPTLWTANISTAFEGEGISYSNNYNVSIYGETG
jgi:hypothetical protein